VLLERLFEAWSPSPAAGVPRQAAEEDGGATGAGGSGRGLGWSPEPALLQRDFSEMTPDELSAVARVVEMLGRRSPTRHSRRTAAASSRRGTVDLPRTLRTALRNGGEPLELCRRRTVQRPRRLVFVCDVSGSMTPYARMLLHFVHGAVSAARDVEAFTFGTELSRATTHLRRADAVPAIEAALAEGGGAGGGTRTGASLAQLNRACGRYLGRGADVLIMSDGWDRGDPDLLARELARVRSCAARIIWLNPLKGHEGYRPLTVGMQAALPHIDELLAVNSVAAITAMTEVLTA
jgi:uncharacterized protein